MITAKQEQKLIDRIKSLSELELEALMEELRPYLRKWNMSRVLEDRDLAAELEEAEECIEELKEKKDDLVDKLTDIEAICENALEVEEYEDKAYEKLCSWFEQIKDLI